MLDSIACTRPRCRHYPVISASRTLIRLDGVALRSACQYFVTPSASRELRSSRRTPTPAPSSATTSRSTTSSARSRMGPQCPSTTRAGWRSWRLRGREAEARRGLRGGHRGRRGGPQGAAQEQVAPTRGGGRLGQAAGAGRRGPGAHFEERLLALEGKGLIVCMSRRICVDLYKAITKLRPAWHSDDDATDWQPHIRNKTGREALAKRFKEGVE